MTDSKTVYIHRNLSCNTYLDIWVTDPPDPDSKKVKAAEIHTIFTDKLPDAFLFIEKNIGSNVTVKNMVQ